MVRVFRSHSGLRIVVGENARENDAIRKGARQAAAFVSAAHPPARSFIRVPQRRQSFYWLHIEHGPSCHVVLESADPDRRDIDDAAQLCKYFTPAARAVRAIRVMYCHVHNVKCATITLCISFGHALILVVHWIGRICRTTRGGGERTPGEVTLKKAPEHVTVETNEASLERMRCLLSVSASCTSAHGRRRRTQAFSRRKSPPPRSD